MLIKLSKKITTKLADFYGLAYFCRLKKPMLIISI